MKCTAVFSLLIGLLFILASPLHGQEAGGIRGLVYDQDFDVPLGAAKAQIVETGAEAETTSEGNYVINGVAPGTYTLVFSKQGFTRQVKTNVVVTGGSLTEVDAYMSGDFVEMEEFVVQDIQFGSNTEIGLIELRIESPALLDSVSAELMSQAGVGDAASALTLVSGATVEDGKFPVIRGLPDRYVNSQINSIRLPTADAKKRAVELDQFPSEAIDSIQVSKTFTPDQQGDASGGAVNVVLKGIPDENVFSASVSATYDSQATGRDDFLSYDGGGVGVLGLDDGSRDIQEENLGENWDGAVGVSRTDSPHEFSASVAAGGKHELNADITLGGYGTLFYERDASYHEGGVDDSYWVENPGDPMTPQYGQGTPQQGTFLGSLYDVTRSSEEVSWGGLGAVGIETENHSLTLTTLFTHDATDSAILAEDTRSKEYYNPGYDPDDPSTWEPDSLFAAPYQRLETLTYQERETLTIQLSGKHKLPDPGFEIEGIIESLQPELDWSVATSRASFYEPDKRLFGSIWIPGYEDPGRPPFVPPQSFDPTHRPLKPDATFTLGNLQRTWKEIEEESLQQAINLKLPFTQWTGDEGYVKFGVFNDDVDREYFQESFSNFGEGGENYTGPWEDFWSANFPEEDRPITAAEIDVDYEGEQHIQAWYYMVDLPVTSFLNIIGGMRFERTEIGIVNIPEEDVTWFPPGQPFLTELNAGDADVLYEQDDVLPSIGFKLKPVEQVTLRGSYSETVARQTFRELTPIIQQEYLGSDVFIGNPNLQMSAVKNYDLRVDYEPVQGSLLSASYFYKDIKDPIEVVQRGGEGSAGAFLYTTPVNFPEGTMEGVELEVRQQMGSVADALDGLTLGANATFIESEVLLSEEEQAIFESQAVDAPMESRDMLNAPEYLYNLYFMYELSKLGLAGTSLAVFYTVRGDTLVAGAGRVSGNLVPSVYEKEYGTLNASITQKIGETWRIKLQAKNILNPDIETVYRSEYIEDDVTKTSYQKGIELSLGVSATF